MPNAEKGKPKAKVFIQPKIQCLKDYFAKQEKELKR